MAMFLWMQNRKIKHHFIDPGKPSLNALVESVKSQIRDKVLNEEIWKSLEEGQVSLDHWKSFYNEVLPHGSLRRKTPME